MDLQGPLAVEIIDAASETRWRHIVERRATACPAPPGVVICRAEPFDPARATESAWNQGPRTESAGFFHPRDLSPMGCSPGSV